MPGDGGRSSWTAFVPVFALAALLRVAIAVQPGLWCDEIFSLAMATGHSLEHPAASADPTRGDYVEPPGVVPASAFRRYVEPESPPAGAARVVDAVLRSDTSPPFYYLVLDRWLRFTGTSDAALRLFSTACALLAMPLLWSIARELGGRRVAVIAGLLFALAPPALYYSVEGRMYALTWLLGLALAHLTLALARRGPRPALVAAWVLVAAAGLLTHYFVAFVWLACAAWLFMHGERNAPEFTAGAEAHRSTACGASAEIEPRAPRRNAKARLGRVTLLLMMAAVGVVLLPWYTRLPASLAAWRVTGTWLDTPQSVGQLAYGVARLGGSLVNSYGVWRGIKLTMPVQLVLLAVLGVAVVRRGAGPLVARERQLALFWLAASVLGPVLLDACRHTAMSRIERYALPGLPAAVLVLALAIDQVFRPVGMVVLAGTVLAWLPGIREVANAAPREWEPFPTIAARVEGWTTPEDLVIVHSIPSGVIGVARYVDPRTPMASWVVQLGGRALPADAEALVAGRCRVAVVRTHDLGAGAAALDAWLRAHATFEREDTLYDEAGVRTTIAYFTRDEPDGRCAHRRSAPRTPTASGSETPPPPAPRSGG